MDLKQSFLLAIKSLLASKSRAILTMLRDYHWCCSGYNDNGAWRWSNTSSSGNI